MELPSPQSPGDERRTLPRCKNEPVICAVSAANVVCPVLCQRPSTRQTTWLFSGEVAGAKLGTVVSPSVRMARCCGGFIEIEVHGGEFRGCFPWCWRSCPRADSFPERFCGIGRVFIGLELERHEQSLLRVD